MSNQQQSRPGCGRMLLVLFGIAFFVVIGVLIWMVYSYRSLEETIRAKGEPVTLAELDAWYTAVPDEENAALVVLQAAGFHREPLADAPIPFYMKQTRLEERVAWKLGDPLPDDVKQAVAEFLAANRECLESLGAIDAFSKSRYPIVARTVLGGRMAHLDSIRSLMRLLVLDTLYKVEIGDAAGASASLERAVRLSETLKGEPFLISQMVRMACHSLAYCGIQHAVNRVAMSEDQLAQLQTLIEAADAPDALHRAMAGERCFVADGSLPIAGNRSYSLFLGAYARTATQYVDASTLPSTERRRVFQQLDAQISRPTIGKYQLSLNPLAAILSPAWSRSAESFDRASAQLRVSAIVIAIERYRLANGVIPESLEALVPNFVAAVPVDPFDAQPLRYIRGDFGYLVYSVGRNLRDEHGAEPEKDARMTGDIVIKVTR